MSVSEADAMQAVHASPEDPLLEMQVLGSYSIYNPPDPRLGAEERASGHSLPSIIMIAVMSAVLVGYAFNIASIQSAAVAALGRVATPAPAQGSAIVPFVGRLIPWLILLPIVVLFYAIMRELAISIGLVSKPDPKSAGKLQPRPLDQFKSDLQPYGISSRIAYRAFLLLQPHLEIEEAPDPRASLELNLRMSPPQIRDLHLALLRATGREADPGARLPAVVTVLDLLAAVQRTPKKPREPLDPVFEPGDPFGRDRPKIKT